MKLNFLENTIHFINQESKASNAFISLHIPFVRLEFFFQFFEFDMRIRSPAITEVIISELS